MLTNQRYGASIHLGIGVNGKTLIYHYEGRPGPKTVSVGLLPTYFPGRLFGAFAPLSVPTSAEIIVTHQTVKRQIYCDIWAGQQISTVAETIDVSLISEGASIYPADAYATVVDGTAPPGAVPPVFSRRFTTAGATAYEQVPPCAAAYRVIWDQTTLPVNSPIEVIETDASGSVATRTFNVTAALNGERYCDRWLPLSQDVTGIRVNALNGLIGKIIFALST